ncbi:MAG: lysine exporter LysO family protein [Anaerolineaceae bacterium]|nr:lysine exporter LysO family protein [Anaerolineaceae bacterium]
MKWSLFLFFVLILGIIVGYFVDIPSSFEYSSIELGLLLLLLFLIGAGIGSDQEVLSYVRKIDLISLLFPVLVAIGSILGAGLVTWLFLDFSIKEGMAVGAGFGYYSLSSLIITQIQGGELALIALLSNILREIITILSAPILVKIMGKTAPIASGGATSMDITLPAIQKYCGNQFVFLAIINGLVLSMLVPFIIPLILR